MRKLAYLLSLLCLAACNTSPAIVPDTTSDSPVMLKLKHDILNGDKIAGNWGWILWYVPVLLMILAWVWKEFINKPLHIEDKTDPEQPTSQDPQQPSA
jgi:hypothetical protein